MKRYDLMSQVNSRGTFLCSKLTLPHLLRAANPHILNLAPPLDLDPKWFAPHVAYTMAKFGMSLCTLGMAAEFKGKVGVNSLWPLTSIDTAAVRFALGGDAMAADSRSVEIMADAAYAILARPAQQCSGNFFIDEEVLREEGVTDFSAYAPGAAGKPLQTDFFVPDAVLKRTSDAAQAGLLSHRSLPHDQSAHAREVQGSRRARQGRPDPRHPRPSRSPRTTCPELAKLTGAHGRSRTTSSPRAWSRRGVLDAAKTPVGMNKGGTISPLGPASRSTWCRPQHSSIGRHDGAEARTGRARGCFDGGAAVGYVIELENGFRIYHTGDTDVFGDMALIGRLLQARSRARLHRRPFHDGSRAGAAFALREFLKPKQVIPMHYGTFPVINRTPAELKAALGNSPIKMIDVKPGEADLRF